MASNNFWKVRKGIVIKSLAVDPSSPDNGSIWYNSTLNKFRKRENGVTRDLDSSGADISGPGSSTDNAIVRWDGPSGSSIQNSTVTLSDAGVLAGASIDADTNTITNIENADIKAAAAIDATKIADGSVDNTEFQRLGAVTSAIVGISDTQTLTNKTIDADLNTISNIDNAGIKAGANIDASKIGTGVVDNTEFNYLNGLTGSIQTQFDNKVTGPASATDNAVMRFDATTGKLSQNSVVIIDDTGNITGVGTLDASGAITTAEAITSNNGGITANDTANVFIAAQSSSVATGQAELKASVQSASTGDAFVRFLVSDADIKWSLGLDNSAGDALKLTEGNNPSSGSTYMQFTQAGAWTMGIPNTIQTQTMNAGKLQVNWGYVNGSNELELRNASTSVNAQSRIILVTESTATGSADPYITFGVSGGTSYSLGTDNSDSDKFKLAIGSGLGSSNILTYDANGRLDLRPLSGQDAILHLETVDNSTVSRIYSSVQSTSTADAYYVAQISGGTKWSWGLDNSDSDKFKISNADGLGASDYFIIDTSGNVSLTNTLVIGSGSVSSPSLAFSADADGSGTGLYRVAANSLGFSANGVNVGQYSALGAWTLGVASTTETQTLNAGKLQVNWGYVSGNNELILENNSTSSNAESRLVLETQSAATGASDPHITFDVAGGTSASIGIDNDSSDDLVFTRSSNLTTNPFLVVNTDGNAIFSRNGSSPLVNAKLEAYVLDSTDATGQAFYALASNNFDGSVGATSNPIFAEVSRSITTSQTDSQASIIGLFRRRVTVPAAQTLTHTGGPSAVCDLRIDAPVLSGGGALSYTGYAKLSIGSDTIATGTRKYGIYFGGLSGATNNALITNSTSFTGNWELYMLGTNPSYFGGVTQFASGSAALPSIAFSADTDTGIYREASDIIGFSSGGSKAGTFGIVSGSPSIQLGNSLTSAFSSIYGAVNDQYLSISGGTGSSAGRNFQIYGGTHATKAMHTEWRRNTTVDGSINGSGKWTLGAAGETQVHRVNGRALEVVGASASGEYIYVQSTGNTAATNEYAALFLEVGGTTTLGDPHLHMSVVGGGVWTMGLDNSDGDSFKICGSGTFGAASTDLIKITSAGAISLGQDGGTQTHTVRGRLDINGPSSSAARIYQLSGGAALSSIIYASIPSLGTGDAYFVAQEEAGTKWSMGLDKSDSSKFKISQADGLGSNDYVQITTGGAVTLGSNAAFIVENGSTTTSWERSTAGNIMRFLVGNLDNTDSTSSAQLLTRVAGSSAGDAYATFSVTGGDDWSLGVDNSDSDKFKISNSTSLGSSDHFVISTEGAIGNGSTSADVALFVNPGTPTLTGTTQIGIDLEGQFSSAATDAIYSFVGSGNSSASAYTVGRRVQFYASNPTKGAGSTITRDISFLSATPTQGTNNAIFSDNATFTGNLGIALSTIRTNYFSGNMLVGGGSVAPFANTNTMLRVYDHSYEILSGASQYGVYVSAAYSSSATTQISSVASRIQSVSGTFTTPVAYAYEALVANKFASHTITRLINYGGVHQTAGTNNAFIADNTSFSGNWFINSNSSNPSFLAGRVGLGQTAGAGTGLFVAHASALSGTDQFGVDESITGQSEATSSITGFRSQATTANASFSVSNLWHFYASNTTKGASSTITRYAMYGGAVPTQGTNNAFLTDATNFAAGNWGIILSTTNPSSFIGPIMVGTASFDDRRMFNVEGTPAGAAGTTHHGIRNNVTFTSTAALGAGIGYSGQATTAAVSYTLPYLAQFYAFNTTKGAGSTITRQVQFLADSPTQATNNALLADNTTFTGDWVIHSSSTRNSELAGKLILGNPAAYNGNNFLLRGTARAYKAAAASATSNVILSEIVETTSGSGETYNICTATPTSTSDAISIELHVHSCDINGNTETWRVIASSYYSGSAQYTTPQISSRGTGASGMTDITCIWSAGVLQLTQPNLNSMTHIEIKVLDRVGGKVTSSYF